MRTAGESELEERGHVVVGGRGIGRSFIDVSTTTISQVVHF
jgi:hypothetical protein